MTRYRFSIRAIMINIVMVAVAAAALRTPSRIWANAWFSLALGAVTFAIPAAAVTGGGRRAFWIGFAVCGWVYFLFALSPFVSEATYYQLFSTTILDMASPYILDNAYMVRTYLQTVTPPGPATSPTPWQEWNLPGFQVADTWQIGYARLHCSVLYLRIGHAAFCLLLALIGGQIARSLHVGRSKDSTDPHIRNEPRRGAASPAPPVQFIDPTAPMRPK